MERTCKLGSLWSNPEPSCCSHWKGTCGATDAAVHLSLLTAATVTPIIHRHLQAIFEAHWLDGEAVVGTTRRAASGFHTHIKWNLMKKTLMKLNSTCSFSTCILLCYTNMPVLCCNPIHLDVEKTVIQNHLNTDKITLAEVLNISFKATCKETTEIVLSVSDCWHLQKNNVLLYPVTWNILHF